MDSGVGRRCQLGAEMTESGRVRSRSVTALDDGKDNDCDWNINVFHVTDNTGRNGLETTLIPEQVKSSPSSDGGSISCGDSQGCESPKPSHRDAHADGTNSDTQNGCSTGRDIVDSGVTRLSTGWLIDEPAQLLRLYGAGGPSAPPLQPDRRLWRIVTPYLMDQQAASIARQMETGDTPAKRRRKLPPPPDPITAAAGRLLRERAAAAASSGPTPAEYRQNNSAARLAARHVLEQSEPPLSGPTQGDNPSDKPRLINSGGHQYVMPAHSRFLCGDVTTESDDVISQLLGDGPKFDCVLLDPPWTNRFIKRKRKGGSYRTLEASDLTRLPLPRLAADGALVAVWCTNSSAHRRTLRHTLLPAWGVRECAVWHWVKVTQHGAPVTPASHHSKQPYEVLVLGRRGPAPPGLPPPPDRQLLVSVPCALHSRKPLLHEVLGAYLPGDYRGLEVFGRGLLPGWTAWGDQPLLLQRVGGLLGTWEHAGQDQTRGGGQAQGEELDQPHGEEKQELPGVAGHVERQQLQESERAAQPAGCGEATAGQDRTASC